MARTTSKRSLAGVVGAETYAVWVKMLQTLVPGGRTHRLAVVVAGMLQYAAALSEDDDEEDAGEPSVAAALIRSCETSDPDDARNLLDDVVTRLFKDAGVEYKRTNSRGQGYTITESIYEEYVRWDTMPWE